MYPPQQKWSVLTPSVKGLLVPELFVKDSLVPKPHVKDFLIPKFFVTDVVSPEGPVKGLFIPKLCVKVLLIPNIFRYAFPYTQTSAALALAHARTHALIAKQSALLPAEGSFGCGTTRQRAGCAAAGAVRASWTCAT